MVNHIFNIKTGLGTFSVFSHVCLDDDLLTRKLYILCQQNKAHHMLKLILSIPSAPPPTSSSGTTHFWQPKIIAGTFATSEGSAFSSSTVPKMWFFYLCFQYVGYEINYLFWSFTGAGVNDFGPSSNWKARSKARSKKMT